MNWAFTAGTLLPELSSCRKQEDLFVIQTVSVPCSCDCFATLCDNVDASVANAMWCSLTVIFLTAFVDMHVNLEITGD